MGETSREHNFLSYIISIFKLKLGKSGLLLLRFVIISPHANDFPLFDRCGVGFSDHPAKDGLWRAGTQTPDPETLWQKKKRKKSEKKFYDGDGNRTPDLEKSKTFRQEIIL